jgi:two-component system cell cycle sensor histidine kinase PleC
MYLLDLINDILDISKIEFGSEEPQNNEIDVPLLIESVFVLIKERAHAARLRIRMVFHDDLPPLKADERKLKQILLNLMSNAIKFTPEGGEVTLEARCAWDEGYLFKVRDTGIGIAPGDIAKALQPFGQIDGALNRKHTGTGLGLPLAKELAEMHGGSMELESEPGVGTTVTVRFPAERIIQLSDDADAAPAPRAKLQ